MFSDIKPYGLSISTLLILGGPGLYRDAEELTAETIKFLQRADSQPWLSTLKAMEKHLIRIDWVQTAPVVFCNEFTITGAKGLRNCRN